MCRHKLLSRATAIFAISLIAAPAYAVTTIDTLAYLNQTVGATTFYQNGFTGTSATIANIEAGYIWDQQILTTQDTVEFADPSAAGQVDLHATAVGSVLNGQFPLNPLFQGIAYNSTVWSGAIATSWTDPGDGSYSGGFNISNASFSTPYYEALITGVPQAGGKTADVVNSSWEDSGDTGGSSYLSVTLDALISMSGKTVVLAAGNGGPTTDSVDAPSSGNNAFVVGGLMSDDSNPPYGSIASFSSVSPTDYFLPGDMDGDTGSTLIGVRARIDITAPATDMVLAYYGGNTGGGAFGYGAPNPPNGLVAYPFDGTSFAAPIVAGGAALVVDAGKTLFPNDANAIDGRIIKAVLMNSADKPPGWNNGQTLSNGVITTKQSLDYTYGSGILDLNQAWTQYTGGTTDLVGANGIPTMTGGTVQPTGWAFGQITHTAGHKATVDYTISTPLTAGTDLNATLVWYSDDFATPDADYADNGLDTTYGSFDNLDLSVFLLTAGSPELVAQSIARYNANQELDFNLPSDGTYMIEVSETKYLYNFVGDTTTPFGLAWSTSVPEPASATIILASSGLLLARRRRA